MPTYQITWEETTNHVAFVRADNELAAHQCWIDDDITGEFTFPPTESHLIEVLEMPGPHDPLCCCPTCETARSDLAVEEWRGTPWPPGNGDPGSVVDPVNDARGEGVP